MFFPQEPTSRMAGQFFYSSGAEFPGSMAADANVMAQRATPQDFKSWRFPLLKRRSEKVGVETRICFIRYISRTTSKYVCVSAQRQKK